MAPDNNKQRKRDALATKETILQAARMVFMNKGYDSAGTREIAERAGVNVALISRYFGSKIGLFEAAVPPALSVEPFLPDDMSTFGAEMAALFVHKNKHEEFDPMVALLRAAASEDAINVLRIALEEQFNKPLAARLVGPNAYERATLIGACLAGYDMSARVIGVRNTTGDDKSQIEALFAKSLQDLVNG